MKTLFFYGTLCHMPLLHRVLGRAPEWLAQATLPDHSAHWAQAEDGAQQSFPLITSSPGHSTQGIVFDASEEDLDRLDFYEGGFGYTTEHLTVETQDGPRQALVYFPPQGAWTPGADWSLPDWQTQHADLTLDACADLMSRYGQVSQGEARALWPFYQARAWARQLARTPAPATLRSDRGYEAVDFHKRTDGTLSFFGLTRFDVAFERFDGTRTDPVSREGFVAFDAALVLPYDPVRDQVLLIEQLRYGPILRTDPRPWVLEPIAGLVDANEAPETCARREAVEEAGLTLHTLEKMAQVYASPGYSSEFFHCYLGLAELSHETGRIAGLDSENEDIRSHILSFDTAMALVDSGEVNAGPLAMMLLWLARHRERLRATA